MVDLFIRVDATPQMGIGHFMRCFALAMHCADSKMQVEFICHELVASCQQKLALQGFKVHHLKHAMAKDQARETLAIADKAQAKAILFDGYQFSDAYFDHFKSAAMQLWMIDDFANTPPYFQLAINFQPWAAAQDYTSHAKTFLGLEYYLLREEFTSLPIVNIKQEHILITIGGTDPHQQTMRVLNILEKCNSSLPICIILGNPIPDIQEYVERAANKNQPISLHVNPENMPLLMAQSLLAITAGGGTCWELASMGVPMIVMTQAQNQQRVAEYVAKHQVGVNLGSYDAVTDQQMSDSVTSLLENESLRNQMRTAGAALNIGAKLPEMTHYMKGQCYP